jgi:hypothetical protein
MNNQLFIPDKIKVGYQERGDTYTGKLAYVIYFDKKGVLRKENSWQGWRDNNIEPHEFINEPTEGFVLNKGVGGARHSYGWNARNEYIRVYDPRGFEFEISVANLLFILQETSAIKGKGLEGEFVYCWEGKELVLLPCESEEYKNSKEFSDLQDKKVTKKDMTPGCLYKHKDQRELMYVGRYDWHQKDYYNDGINIFKCHVFYNVESNEFCYEKGFTKLALKLSETPAENYSDVAEQYRMSKYGTQIVGFKDTPFSITKKVIEKKSWRDYYYIKQGDGKYLQCDIHEDYDWNGSERVYKGYYISKRNIVSIVGSKLTLKSCPYEYNRREKIFSLEELNELDFTDLKVVLESGSEVSYNKY